MHAAFAFIIGVFVAIGAFLLFAAFSGITYYGIAIQVEGSLSAALFVVALILALIFYAGVKAQFRRVKTGKEALIGAKGLEQVTLNLKVKSALWVSSGKPPPKIRQ